MNKGIDYTGITVSFRCHDGDGNYVMHKRGAACRDEQGMWDFGGGGLKFNESLEEGLRREAKEEYNADIIDLEFLGHKELFREHEGQKTHWISFIYRVRVDREQVINNEPEKHDELGWFKIANPPSPLHSMIKSDFENYKDKL